MGLVGCDGGVALLLLLMVMVEVGEGMDARSTLALGRGLDRTVPVADVVDV